MKFGSKAKIDKEFGDLEKWDTDTVVSRIDLYVILVEY